MIDYGIYNAVGGFVAMFTILCGSLSTAISRFLTFELGRKDANRLNSVFSVSVSIQLVLAVIIAILAEVVGLWFLNNKMVIPGNRIVASNWVFQFSVLSFVLGLIYVPFNAAIIAHERMSAFAYISIYEGMAKLFVAFAILNAPIDRLILFALLIVVIQFTIGGVYVIYCKRHFQECTFKFAMDKILFKEMFGFAGWTFIGSSAVHLRDQGGNILINLFFGPAVNAARGIAMKVNVCVQQFVTNFMMALNPQITKNYANGNYDYMFKLIFTGARFSYYLLLILSLPILICTDFILGIWLKEVPEHTAIFAKLFLLLAMSDSLSNPITTAQAATGNIRNYQLVVGGTMLLNLPIVYVLFRMGFHPAVSVIVAIAISQICLFLKLLMFKKNVSFSVQRYFKEVYLNVLLVSFVASFFPIVIYKYLPESSVSFICMCLVSLLTSALSVCYVGCNKKERTFIYSKCYGIIVSKGHK